MDMILYMYVSNTLYTVILFANEMQLRHGQGIFFPNWVFALASNKAGNAVTNIPMMSILNFDMSKIVALPKALKSIACAQWWFSSRPALRYRTHRTGIVSAKPLINTPSKVNDGAKPLACKGGRRRITTTETKNTCLDWTTDTGCDHGKYACQKICISLTSISIGQPLLQRRNLHGRCPLLDCLEQWASASALTYPGGSCTKPRKPPEEANQRRGLRTSGGKSVSKAA